MAVSHSGDMCYSEQLYGQVQHCHVCIMGEESQSEIRREAAGSVDKEACHQA